MAQTFDQYSSERAENQSDSARAASRVFECAYTFGMDLLEARQRAGMTQAQVAETSGVDQGDISRIEHGRMIPETATLARLAEALGGSLELRFDKQTSTGVATATPAYIPSPGTIVSKKTKSAPALAGAR